MGDVLVKVVPGLVQLPRDRLGLELLGSDVRVPALERFKVSFQFVFEGFGVVHLLQHGHAVVVLDPIALHLVHSPGLGLVHLRVDDGAGGVEHSLEDGEHVQRVPLVPQLTSRRVVRSVGLEQRGKVLDREQREGLGERELVPDVEAQVHRAAARVHRTGLLDDPGVLERAVHADGPPLVLPLSDLRLVVVNEEVPEETLTVSLAR